MELIATKRQVVVLLGRSLGMESIQIEISISTQLRIHFIRIKQTDVNDNFKYAKWYQSIEI